jgi:hypothetical protein
LENDIIVDDVRKHGLALAARYNNNLEEICKALKEKERSSGRRVVNRAPRQMLEKAKDRGD